MKQAFSLSKFGTDLALSGALTMIMGASFYANCNIGLFELIMHIGVILIFIPVLIFHFALTAGLAGPQITWSDFKRIWLWFFQIGFLVGYTLLFFGINRVFNFIPNFEDEYALFTPNYLEVSIYCVSIIYLIVTISGLVYRLAVSRKVKLA
jgi:hypothetical protein